MILAGLAGLALLLALLVLAGHSDERQTLDRWDMTLNPEGHQVYSTVAEQLDARQEMCDGCFEDAERAKTRGNLAEALRLLDLGAALAVSRADGLRSLLRNIAVLATHAAALAPMPPLWPRQFNARRLATLAGIHALVHHLLASGRERLALRLAVLRFGVRIASRLVRTAASRLVWRTEEAAEWRRLDEARGDMGTLTEEAKVTLRLVLTSLAAVERSRPVTARKPA